MGERILLDERFDGDRVDTARWSPHYLPAWSSRDATRASARTGAEGLVLDVPVDHPRWCPDLHEPALRVSGLQSGGWSGPVGSTRGQQRFAEGLLVREQQPRFEGCLVSSGEVTLEARMHLSPRSMAALWLSGVEDDAEQLRCGELCVVEVFGRSVAADDAGRPSAEVGVGVKPFRDPALTDDFAAPRVPLDVGDWHTYGVRWTAAESVHTVDDVVLRRCASPPTYPLQLMLAVFDFPGWSTGDDHHVVPRLEVRRVRVTG